MQSKPFIVDFPDNLILQRSSRVGGIFGHGSANLHLEVLLSTCIRVLEYKLRDFIDPSITHQDWRTAADDLSAGHHRLTLSIPAQRAWYLLEIRADYDNLTIATSTSRFGAGDIIAVYGQSLAVDFFSATNNDGDTVTISSLGIHPSPFSAAFASWHTDELHNFPPMWSVPSDTSVYRSAFVAEFLRLMVQSSSVNCGLIGYGKNGQTISQLMPNTTNNRLFKEVTTLSRTSFCLLLYIQGHGDSIDSTPPEQYHTRLSVLIEDLTATFGDFKSAYCSVPSLVGTTEGCPGSVNHIRAAQIRFVSEHDTRAYVAGLDAQLDRIRMPVGVHPNQEGDMVLARHFYRSATKLLGRGSGDDGPTITGASIASDGYNIDLFVRHVAGTALVGIGAPLDQARQFKVRSSEAPDQTLEFDSEMPIDLTIPGRIRLKLALPIAPGEEIDVWYRLPPDSISVVAAGIYDNALDDDGLTRGRQLRLSTAPFTIRRPWHENISTKPGRRR